MEVPLSAPAAPRLRLLALASAQTTGGTDLLGARGPGLVRGLGIVVHVLAALAVRQVRALTRAHRRAALRSHGRPGLRPSRRHRASRREGPAVAAGGGRRLGGGRSRAAQRSRVIEEGNDQCIHHRTARPHDWGRAVRVRGCWPQPAVRERGDCAPRDSGGFLAGDAGAWRAVRASDSTTTAAARSSACRGHRAVRWAGGAQPTPSPRATAVRCFRSSGVLYEPRAPATPTSGGGAACVASLTSFRGVRDQRGKTLQNAHLSLKHRHPLARTTATACTVAAGPLVDDRSPGATRARLPGQLCARRVQAGAPSRSHGATVTLAGDVLAALVVLLGRLSALRRRHPASGVSVRRRSDVRETSRSPTPCPPVPWSPSQGRIQTTEM